MRILFIKPSSLGDIVHGLQLAESLRQELPDLSISWVAREIFAPLVQACDTVDEVFVFHRSAGPGGFFRLVGQLRRQEFDWVVDLQGLFRSGLLTGFAKGVRKAGRADAREFSGLFYGERPGMPPAGVQSHALDILLQFRKLFGLKPELTGQLRFTSSLPVGFPARDDSSRTFLFFPESRRAEKQWPFFKELTRELLASSPCRIIWAGSGGVEAPADCPSDRFVNLCGQTALECLPAMLADVDGILANDSGPMHLAAAMGRPVLALFGPTDPARFGPYCIPGAVAKVLEAPKGKLGKLEVDTVKQALLGIALSK